MSSERPSGINYLNRLGHQLRLVRHAFLDNDPTTRALITHDSLSRITNPNLADEFLEKQLGGKPWLSEDDEDIPESAKLVIQRSFLHRSEPLWMIQLFEKDSAVRTSLTDGGVSRDFGSDRAIFMKKYGEVASTLGLFPTPPMLDQVPNQRLVPKSVRTLAAQVMFFDKLTETQNLRDTGAFFVNMLADAQNSYIQSANENQNKSPQEILQETILKKENKRSEELVAELTRFNMWDSTESLAMMCVDRGLRDLVVDYYGVFRDISTEGGSGYKDGQQIMAIGAVIRSCFKVA